jgi:archaemetzincin
MELQNITLIPFGQFDVDFLDEITEAVRQEFHYPVRTKEGHLDLSEFYNPGRRQYDGMKLLKEVESRAAPGSVKTIGLFDVDLYIPIFTYIFGQAYLNGRVCIASVFRLKNERYGIPESQLIIKERLIKEVIHELGHTFGLIHCHQPECVMRSSTYVEDIDQKSSHYCPACRSKLGF